VNDPLRPVNDIHTHANYSGAQTQLAGRDAAVHA